MAVDKRIKSGADGDGLSPVAGPTSHTAPEQMDTDISMEPVDVDLPTTSRTADGSQILEEHAAAETNDITSTAVLLVEPPSTLNAVSTYTSPKITSTPNPEVINQVLNVVPSMLTHLHSLLDVASSENTLLSSDTNKEAAMAKIQSTTASLFSGQSASNDIITKLTERMNSLESEVKSNQEALKQSNEENARTSQRIIELEERLRTYEASPRSSDPSIIAPNPVLNGISTVRLTTPLSRTSSVDENCPLPIKSQRKQMNLIAMSPSRPPSSGGI
ncbi:hypothetical protein BDQ17DRAFT_1102561 [Cyathus striatus]|nr:hypothetical protein BDQ17DRAFT_1102561 [Cyathus striatus]